MTAELNVNQNYAECIKSVSNWGETVYANICTHATQVVAWGSMDYLLVVTGLLAALVIGVFVIRMGLDAW